MKFTKESLLDTLKAKLTVNGKHLAISERTLKSQIDTLYAIGVNEETEMDAFVEQILPGIESLRGNYEKDNADFVNQWKKDHPVVDTLKPKEKSKDASNDKLDALMKEIQALKDANESSKREKTISEKKSALISAMKEKGIKDQKWLEQFIANTAITEDMDVESKTTSAVEFYNLAHSSIEPSATPSTAGNPPVNTAEMFADVATTIKRQRHITDGENS